MKHALFRPSGITLLSTALVTLFAAPAISAPSVCKGLDEAACAAQAECRWMDGYTRKDGVQVSSHCRKGAKKDAAPQAMPKTDPAAVAAEATKGASPAPAAMTAPAPATKTTP